MADITIDTTSPQYTQLLNGLQTLRTVLAPRVQMIRRLERAQQRWWLERDPLLRRTIILATQLSDLVDQELQE